MNGSFQVSAFSKAQRKMMQPYFDAVHRKVNRQLHILLLTHTLRQRIKNLASTPDPLDRFHTTEDG